MKFEVVILNFYSYCIIMNYVITNVLSEIGSWPWVYSSFIYS